MKRLSFNSKQVKRGMASFYVVIFATILFGVVTVSFMRIILSEASQSSDDDLSRSAYDAANAGVEDAKTAINRYYSCLNGSYTGANRDEVCGTAARDKLFSNNCDDRIGLAQYLYGADYTSDKDDVEVKIQESSNVNSDTTADQAYTCVIISDQVPDYRGTLTSDTPTKAVPIGVYNGSDGTNSTLNRVETIKFQWYSRLNEGDTSKNIFNQSDGETFRTATDQIIPPVIALTFIQMKSGVSSEEFQRLSNKSDSGLVYSTLVLLPSDSGSADAKVTYTELKQAGNVSSDTLHTPVAVQCDNSGEFACSVQLTNLEFAQDDSVFLIASLPYNDTSVDFSATLYEDGGNTVVNFTGVQIQVDSTGRTNQLVRRVEARLDPVDLFFPYPSYELFLDGNDEESIRKAFWITANCWHSHPLEGGGTAKACSNNSEIQILDSDI